MLAKFGLRQLSGAIVTSLVFASLTGTAQASSLTFSSYGTWNNTQGGSYINNYNVNASGVWSYGSQTTGDNQVRWGYPVIAPYAQYQSGLGFTGDNAKSVNLGSIFLLGTLRHFNNPIWAGTAASAVDFILNLSFGAGGSQVFNYTMSIDETPNSGVCPYYSVTPCSDKIAFANDSLARDFSWNGQAYSLNILGFSDATGTTPINEFISQEGGTSEAYLYGQITPIPEPITMVGTGLSLLGMGVMRRRQIKMARR
jgi:hypothetical protein